VGDVAVESVKGFVVDLDSERLFRPCLGALLRQVGKPFLPLLELVLVFMPEIYF
jgi:hypothetical protein